jgi:hypothetical protein
MKNFNTKTTSHSKRQFLAKLIIAISVIGFLPLNANAGTFSPRSVTLSDTAASATSTYKFDFTTGSTGSVGSIEFLYCTTASGTCTTPTGLTTTSATLTAQTGATGFTMVNTTNGAPYITRTASSISSATALSYTVGVVTNPSATNTTFFVRLKTFATTTATGSSTDAGVVAASTANHIVVNAQVDEILTFCVYTGANCAAGGSTVDLGVLTPAVTGTGLSLMDAGTNAGSGFAIQYNAPTLTSGGNTIPAVGATAVAPVLGTGQFGINATGPNIAPAVTGSAAPTGVSPIGAAATNYATADFYAFVAGTPTTIATSSGAANTTTFTVSYLANVNSSQAAGAYTSTFVYICTATF